MKTSRKNHSFHLRVVIGIVVVALAALTACAATPTTTTEDAPGSGSKDLPEGVSLFDFDGDGDMDLRIKLLEGLYQEPHGEGQGYIFVNLGDGTFKEVSAPEGKPPGAFPPGCGAAFGDLDGDGDLDVILISPVETPKDLEPGSQNLPTPKDRDQEVTDDARDAGLRWWRRNEAETAFSELVVSSGSRTAEEVESALAVMDEYLRGYPDDQVIENYRKQALGWQEVLRRPEVPDDREENDIGEESSAGLPTEYPYQADIFLKTGDVLYDLTVEKIEDGRVTCTLGGASYLFPLSEVRKIEPREDDREGQD